MTIHTHLGSAPPTSHFSKCLPPPLPHCLMHLLPPDRKKVVITLMLQSALLRSIEKQEKYNTSCLLCSSSGVGSRGAPGARAPPLLEKKIFFSCHSQIATLYSCHKEGVKINTKPKLASYFYSCLHIPWSGHCIILLI